MMDIKIFFYLLLIIFFIGCKKDEKISFNNTENGDFVVKGEYKDPFSLQYMQQALEQLKFENKIPNNLNIQVRPTHLYVEFIPKTWDEYDLLVLNDRNLLLFDYPLNQEVQVDNDYFPTEFEIQSITSKFACIKSDYPFRNDIEYKILGERYFPDIDSLFPNVENRLEIIKLLEERAELIANPHLINLENGDGNLLNNWNPNGTIMVTDDEVAAIEQSSVPLRGVQVRVRRWTKIRTALTNENGFFSISTKFNRPVNYAIFYQRKDFDIRSGKFGQAWYNGPKKSGSWDLLIDNNPQRYYSHIFQAANDYWYAYVMNFNIGLPPQNSFWRPAIKIGAINGTRTNGSGVTHVSTRLFGIFTQINIYSLNWPTSTIYATTIHEIGHASHWWQNSFAYNNCEDKVAEGWCRGVEYYLTNYRYWKVGEFYQSTFLFSFFDGWQWLNTWDGSYVSHMQKGYIPIVIDLIDNYNQRIINGNNIHYAPDNISNFTLTEIWNSLNGALTLNDWKENLKKYNKVQAVDLDALFDFYINI